MRCLKCMKEYGSNENICPYCGFEQNSAPKEPYHLYPGTVLKQRYQIGTVLGFGGFGVVYKAWDSLLNCVVAIKEYFPTATASRLPNKKIVKVSSNKKYYEEFQLGKIRFLEEARIMAKFAEHPNIVKIFDFFEENNTGYIVMEFLDGLNIGEYLKNEGRPLDIEDAISIMEAVCDILHVIHQAGILHRDIAPDNIFLCVGGKIKLLDLGAARIPNVDANLTRILKPGYAPPEQYSNDENQGIWTDVYALGATLYRMVTGKVPEESTNRKISDILIKPRALNKDIPEYLEKVILRAMSMIPQMRYQSVMEFKNALRDEKGAMNDVELLKKKKKIRLVTIICVVMLIAGGSIVAFVNFSIKKKTAELPQATVSIWIEQEDNKNSDNMDSILEEFNENYGDHVKVEVKVFNEDEYEKVVSEAVETNSLPTLFYSKDVNEMYSEYAENISDINFDAKLLFEDDVKSCIKNKNAFPMGFDMYVVYVNTDMSDKKIDIEKIIEDNSNYDLDKFNNEESAFYVGSTENYYEILQNTKIAKYVKIYDTENDFLYFTDYWYVNKQASSDEIICAKAILSYLIEENCQRLFFTVDSTRLSDSIPLNKNIFDTNYYKNGVSDKMKFIGEIDKKDDKVLSLSVNHNNRETDIQDIFKKKFR